MNNFRKLKIWNEGIELATEIYSLTKSFPKSEMFGITSQMRRSVVSVSSNIAEGAGRQSKKEFIHFLNIAKGSCYELETQLLISKNIKYISDDLYQKAVSKLIIIEKMIHALIKSIEFK